MTPAQQAALEQAAREWLYKNVYNVYGFTDAQTTALVTLLAAQRAAVLEECTDILKNRIGLWKSHGGAQIASPYSHLTVEGELEVVLRELQEQRP